MIMTEEFNLQDISEFKTRTIDILEAIADASKAVIPINDSDKRIIQKGVSDIQKYIEGLRKAETPREINKYIDLQEMRGQDYMSFIRDIQRDYDAKYDKFVHELMEDIPDE